ncbi:MAG: UDP-glucose--hexose-1-phosphate uridylyltransferase [Lachnospiraceae bacterium]|jgi:UDPglucose--hexose-1-phosphate uridylyltransferase|nr:UDP-glucose--hexose-1-phosphate uridylyltransferase [Lachnospiraceae bacterium]
MIGDLIHYGIDKNLIKPEDAVYAYNRMLDVLELNMPPDCDVAKPTIIDGAPVVGGKGVERANSDGNQDIISKEEFSLEEILRPILDNACSRGLIEDTVTSRDLLDTKLLGTMTPFPHEVISEFWEKYNISPKEATDWYYDFSQNTDYIRRYRMKRDLRWVSATDYGDLEITINLSKPEKDPKEIAKAKNAAKNSYPKCLLCYENEGYAGNLSHPARQNHRVIPLTLSDRQWFLQYSPYTYYNEHCIVFSAVHEPMKIHRQTFERLLEFVSMFPHYFIGSNADLPIVGGSILSHDHFQGGRHEFPMMKALVEESFSLQGWEDLSVGLVKWPMSVIRIEGSDKNRIIELCDLVLSKWRAYSDETVGILAFSGETPHNTITPIARFKDGQYIMDLVLRNNRTSKEHPDGIFHPHAELHHIKKENIGLIEVMGLAVLPARLKPEIESKLYSKEYIGLVFLEVLSHSGVFKSDSIGREAFRRFIGEICR